jgi:hypothetical protein
VALKRDVRTFIGIVLPEKLRYDYDDGTDYVEIDLSAPQKASDRRAGASGPQEG